MQRILYSKRLETPVDCAIWLKAQLDSGLITAIIHFQIVPDTKFKDTSYYAVALVNDGIRE